MVPSGSRSCSCRRPPALGRQRPLTPPTNPPCLPSPPSQTFFSNALAAVGGTTAGPGLSVVNVYLNYEKKFAFVEFRTGAALPWGAVAAVEGLCRCCRPLMQSAARAAAHSCKPNGR